MGEWIICERCSLKYRAREPVCPRCETPPGADQERWGDHVTRPRTSPPPSKFAIGVPLVLLTLGCAGALVYFAAGFFNPSLPQKLEQACVANEGTDCACVGKTTAELMSSQQRASFETEDTATRALMNTASQLCLSSRLVTKCEGAREGTEVQCRCIVNAAVNEFSNAELEQLFAQGPQPSGYAGIREGCSR